MSGCGFTNQRRRTNQRGHGWGWQWATTRAIRFTNLPRGKDVWVRVRARNSVGAGAWSDPATIHSYKTFTIDQMVQSATDDCDGNVIGNVVIEKATSDEVENSPGPGDGNTLNDIVIASDCKSVQLRAERDGTKDGRVYLVTLRVSDTSGNTSCATYKVSVRVGKATAVDSGVNYTVTSNCPGSCP